MEERIKYLNYALNNNLVYQGPKYLYKYRPFDKYTFDMLENEYLFLCKASNLDDKSECDVSLDLNSIVDLETNNAKRECVNQIIEMISPFSTDENYELVKSKLHMISNVDGTIRPNYLLDLSFELQEMCPGVDIAPFINWIVNIPEKLDDPSIKPQIEKLINIGLHAKENIGICSLCDSCDVEELWDNYYADYGSGYCVEYDVSNYEFNKSIFPVIYTDDRKNNLVMVLVENFINQMISGFSNGKLITDKTQYIRLFLTKSTEWNYQREWRLLGDANQKIKAPRITKIIVGSEISKQNYEKLKDFCCKNNILLQRRNKLG